MTKENEPVQYPLHGWADKIAEQHPEMGGMAHLLEGFSQESPRGIVLTLGGFLEQQLRELLKGYMMDVPSASSLLEGGMAPLGSFGAMINACFAMGLVNADEFSDLNLIRRIRNKFAHEFDASFERQDIRDLCGNFNFAVQPFFDEEEGPIEPTTQVRFTGPSMSLVLSLWFRVREVADRRLTAMEWHAQF